MLGKEILTLLKKSEKRPLVCFKKKKKKKLRFELAALNKFVLSRKKRTEKKKNDNDTKRVFIERKKTKSIYFNLNIFTKLINRPFMRALLKIKNKLKTHASSRLNI